MSGFVYIWRDRKHKRYYVGSHWGTKDDGYICSSSWMIKAYKRRPEDFKRRILTKISTSRQDLLLAEYWWLSQISESELGIQFFNLTNYMNGHWSTDENQRLSVKQKVSLTKQKFWSNDTSNELRKSISDHNKTKGIKPPSRKGKIPWNKGLKKETDSRVAANAAACCKPKSDTSKMGRYKKK